ELREPRVVGPRRLVDGGPRGGVFEAEPVAAVKRDAEQIEVPPEPGRVQSRPRVPPILHPERAAGVVRDVEVDVRSVAGVPERADTEGVLPPTLGRKLDS